MKHILPLLLIGGIVLGVVFFLEDDYEEPFNTDLTDEDTSDDWTATFFLKELSSEDPEIGVRLEHISTNLQPESVTDLEIFIEGSLGDLYFQSLEIEDFTGTITFSEVCERCAEFRGEPVEVTARFNWRDEAGVSTDNYYFQLPELE